MFYSFTHRGRRGTQRKSVLSCPVKVAQILYSSFLCCLNSHSVVATVRIKEILPPQNKKIFFLFCSGARI